MASWRGSALTRATLWATLFSGISAAVLGIVALVLKSSSSTVYLATISGLILGVLIFLGWEITREEPRFQWVTDDKKAREVAREIRDKAAAYVYLVWNNPIPASDVQDFLQFVGEETQIKAPQVRRFVNVWAISPTNRDLLRQCVVLLREQISDGRYHVVPTRIVGLAPLIADGKVAALHIPNLRIPGRGAVLRAAEADFVSFLQLLLDDQYSVFNGLELTFPAGVNESDAGSIAEAWIDKCLRT